MLMFEFLSRRSQDLREGRGWNSAKLAEHYSAEPSIVGKMLQAMTTGGMGHRPGGPHTHRWEWHPKQIQPEPMTAFGGLTHATCWALWLGRFCSEDLTSLGGIDRRTADRVTCLLVASGITKPLASIAGVTYYQKNCTWA